MRKDEDAFAGVHVWLMFAGQRRRSRSTQLHPTGGGRGHRNKPSSATAVRLP